MTSTSRNRLIAVIAILVAASGLAFIAFGKMGDNLVYYWSPGEMLAKGDKAYGPMIRLGGLVVKDSVQRDGTHVKFRVADSKEPNAPSVLVDCSETPPQMFREGIGVVVEGTYDRSGVFSTSRLMVKHSNEYRPPKPGENPKDYIKTATDEPTAALGPKANP